MDDPVGGWIRPVPLSQDPVQRLAEVQRREVEDELRAVELHAAWFGGVADQSAIWVDMPLSKMSFGWRADGYVAERPTEDLADLRDRDVDCLVNGEPLWARWTGPQSGMGHGGEVWPGDSADATWWLGHGQLYPNDTVRCWLADDSDVPVIRLGCLWIVEYVSRPQTLFIRINDDEVDFIGPIRPAFLPAAPHPDNASVQDPRARRGPTAQTGSAADGALGRRQGTT